MALALTNIPPMRVFGQQKTFIELFHKELKKSNRLIIAVGYLSSSALSELETIAESKTLKSVTLIVGMYYQEGYPERLYHQTVRLAKKWKLAGKGEIRLVTPFKYHGKAYGFFNGDDSIPFSAIVGSANLSALKPDAGTLRQYELSVLVEDRDSLIELGTHLAQLKEPPVSKDILDLELIHLIPSENDSLTINERVVRLTEPDRDYYRNLPAELSFKLKLKVPKESEKFMDDGKHFTKSNINVCYASPRSRTKNRDWFETQITVGSNIYKQPGYPKKNEPFFIMTDDGYWFKAHTTSDNNKQFNAVGDELLMGRWLKGRLQAAGLIEAVNDTGLDRERKGMITQEILDEYGKDELLFEKTSETSKDENGNNLPVWRLSFEKSDSKEDE